MMWTIFLFFVLNFFYASRICSESIRNAIYEGERVRQIVPEITFKTFSHSHSLYAMSPQTFRIWINNNNEDGVVINMYSAPNFPELTVFRKNLRPFHVPHQLPLTILVRTWLPGTLLSSHFLRPRNQAHKRTPFLFLSSTYQIVSILP